MEPRDLASRGCDWLLDLLTLQGELQGGADLRAYYKTPSAFLAHGLPNEAHLLLDYVEAKHLLPNGDLDATGVPWISSYRTYPHSWLCCAAMSAGRFALARQLSGFIASYHNPASGGFFADEARTHEEIMTTAMAGLACLWAGHRSLATAAGNWLGNLYRAQPDLSRGLYTTWRNGLVTEYDADQAASFLVDATKPRQYYFQYGIAAVLLSSLAAATGEARWLELARNFLGATQHLGPDRYQTPQSGKVGWGAAWTYRLSRDPAELELVEAVTAGLAALQNDDGSWLATGEYGGSQAPADSATIDVTSELAALLSYMSQAPHDA
jgi:hypothetical protein